NAVGNGLDNRLTGTAFADTLFGGAGSDVLVAGDGSDRIVYERPSDGSNSVAALAGFDRIKAFTSGSDDIVFGVEFNGGNNDLDDIADDNDFVFATDL